MPPRSTCQNALPSHALEFVMSPAAALSKSMTPLTPIAAVLVPNWADDVVGLFKATFMYVLSITKISRNARHLFGAAFTRMYRAYDDWATGFDCTGSDSEGVDAFSGVLNVKLETVALDVKLRCATIDPLGENSWSWPWLLTMRVANVLSIRLMK